MMMKKLCILLVFLLAVQVLPSAAQQNMPEEETRLFFDDFETQDALHWETESSAPVFVVEEDGENTVYSVGSADYYEKQSMDGLRNYCVAFDMKMDYRSSNGAYGNWPALRFRVRGDTYYHVYLYTNGSTGEIALQKFIGGQEYWLGTASVKLAADNEKWVSVRVVLAGAQVELYYKDMKKPLISVMDTDGETPSGGSFCFLANGVSAFYIDNLTVEHTRAVRNETERISKETNREIYHFYDYESQPDGSGVYAESDGNHYLDSAEVTATGGVRQDFVTRFNWRRDYKPYGVDKPVFTFGDGYEIVFDSGLEQSGAALIKNGAELSRERIYFADDDGAWTAVGLSVIGSVVELYYGGQNEPVLQYDAGAAIPEGEVTLSGGDVDNWYLASAYRQKPVEILSIKAEETGETLELIVRAVSHSEESMQAAAVAAGYTCGLMQALTVVPVTLKGNDCNAAEKQVTEISLLLPAKDGADYLVYLWDGLRPLSDAAALGEELQRLPMPPYDGGTPQLQIMAECVGEQIQLSGSVDDAEQSITILVNYIEENTDKTVEIAPEIGLQTVYLAQLARPEQDGTFSLSLDAENLQEGGYCVFAASDDAPIVRSDVEYLKPENVSGFLEEINLTADADSLRLLLLDPTNSRYGKRLGMDLDNFINLNQKTLQNGVCGRVLAERGEGFAEENIGEVFSRHLAFALIKTAKGGSAMRELLAENRHLYPLSGTAGERYLAAMAKVQEEACAGLLKRLKELKYNSIEDVMAELEQNVVLADIFCANYKHIRGLLVKYESLLGIDLDELEDLTGTQETAAVQAMNRDRCYTYEEFRTCYSGAIEQAKQPAQPTRRPGGNGGGGGGSSSFTVVPTAAPSAAPTAAPSVAPTEPRTEVSYADMPREHWAHEAVSFLANQEPPAVSGYEDGRFYPDRKVTRAEFVKLIMQAFRFDAGSAECSYVDVHVDAWYYPFAAAAQAAGVVTGTDDGRFAPEEEITRQDMAVMLCRAAEIKLIPMEQTRETVFPDGDTVSVYAQKAVETLAGAGVIGGTDGGMLKPFAPATRAQAAKMIYEIMK